MADAMVLKRRLEDERSLLSLLEGISAEGYVLNTWLYYIEAYLRQPFSFADIVLRTSVLDHSRYS